MAEGQRDVATWRIILAFVLDALTAFIVFGYLVATLFGGRTEGGFSLSGGPALLMLALVVGYFLIAPRFGGRLCERILGAVRRV
jgi:hypothetical protein